MLETGQEQEKTRFFKFIRPHFWTDLNGCRQRLLFTRQLTQRKCSLCSQGKLCWDKAYKQPTPAQAESGIQVPEISERQVWNCLQHLKKTATRPDAIPFWVWRDHSQIFTPLICKI